MSKNKQKYEATLKTSVSKISIWVFVIFACLFFVFSLAKTRVLEEWLSTVFEILAIISNIVFSFFGVSLALELTTIHDVSKKVANEMAITVLDETTKLEHMKKNNSSAYARDLLYLSYLPEGSEITQERRLILESQGNILKKLITSVYIENDIMDITYYKENGKLKKKLQRKIVFKNYYREKHVFEVLFSYNKQEEDMFKLNYFAVNGKEVKVEPCKAESKDNTYNECTALRHDLSSEESTVIEYKVELVIADDDKTSIFNSRYLTQRLQHNIEIESSANINRCDVSIFCLLNSIDEKGIKHCRVENLDASTNSMKKRISSDDWMFPSDGYNLLFS